MATEHVDIPDGEIHEPKGISTASTNEVYQADGAGSGDWVSIKYHIGGYVSFDSATPAYSLTTGGTSDVVINPTFTGTHSDGFTALTSPNARMRYDGTPGVHVQVSFNGSLKQSSGGTVDIEIVVAKNGTVQEGSRVIRSATNGSWGSVSLNYDLELSTNDYVEFFLKTPGGSATAQFAQMYMNIVGHAEL